MVQILSGIGCYIAFFILVLAALLNGLANILGPWGTVIAIGIVILILLSMNNNKPNKPNKPIPPVEKTPPDKRTVEVR